MRCVIVDDSQQFLASAKRLLELHGLSIVGCAASRSEALALVDRLAPDVVLVDVELGGESGLDLAEELAVRAGSAQVVMISTHDRDEVVELLAESAAIGFLPKADLSARAIVDLLQRAET
jgi:two-component system nitrate/nitrite response regulator NarL